MKKLISLYIAVLVLFAAVLPLGAEIPENRQLPLLVDDASLLTEDEYNSLNSILEEISLRQECDVAVVTVLSLDGKTAEAYADDFYDYNGYSWGENNDGVLLLISMGEREWHISPCGYGITAFTDYGIEQIGSDIVSDLSGEYYYDAFVKFANDCDDYIEQARSGSPIDYGTGDGGYFYFNYRLLLAGLAVGFVIALIVVSVMKGQLKSVRANNAAAEYVVPGSMNVTRSSDMFLYRNVSRTAKPKDTDSGGGSSTHTSSSGTTHGGGGGHF